MCLQGAVDGQTSLTGSHAPWTWPFATREDLAYGVVQIHTVGATNVMQEGVRAMRSLVTVCIVLLSVVVGCASQPTSPVRSAARLVPVPVPDRS
jgi:hypothetical protein